MSAKSLTKDLQNGRKPLKEGCGSNQIMFARDVLSFSSIKGILMIGTLVKTGLALGLIHSAAHAASCELKIDSTDQMQYSTKELKTKASCKEVSLKLTHAGKLNKQIMGHNWVLVETKNLEKVKSAALKAGAGKEYLPDDKSMIIASTKMLGGGENTTIKFPGSSLKAGGDYTYFCTFPGHNALMVGKLVVSK